MPMSMRHLVHFKILVSMAKQQKLKEGEAHLAKHFGFLDDTPAYYFAKGRASHRKQARQRGQRVDG